MNDILLSNIFQVATLIFAIGVFFNQSKNTRVLVDELKTRLMSVELQAASSTAILSRAVSTLDKVDERLSIHERTSPCESHTSTLKFLQDEISHIRGRVDERNW